MISKNKSKYFPENLHINGTKNPPVNVHLENVNRNSNAAIQVIKEIPI